ncbi:MAG: bL21 family ribosomal protein, partial [Bacteroidota bacterium]|nr:bL21 family ribosomal protein [Bacteroidota bacterium]
LKGDKVIVFKKKRRKGYQKSNGHRQQFTQILVQGILGKGETLKDEIAYEKRAPRTAVKPEVEVKETKKAAPKKAAAKKEAAPAKEKAPAKKAAPKKAAKKSAE